MRIAFTVYGEARPEARRTYTIPLKSGRPLVRNVRTAAVSHWMEDVRSQALAHKPDTLHLGAVRIAVEFVLPRPKYLEAPKYWWRCKSRKCGWKGELAEAINSTVCPEILIKDASGVGVYRQDNIHLAMPLLRIRRAQPPCPVCAEWLLSPQLTPPHTVKPDVMTNLAKPTEDALTGLFWKDDSQVVEGTAKKRYAEIGEQPHVAVIVDLLEDSLDNSGRNSPDVV